MAESTHEIIIENISSGDKRTFISDYIQFNSFRAAIKINLPIKNRNLKPIFFLLIDKAEPGILTANQTIHLIKGAPAGTTITYNKKGDITIKSDGTGQKTITFSENFYELYNKMVIVNDTLKIHFDVVTAQKTTSPIIEKQEKVNETAKKVVYKPPVQKYEIKKIHYDSKEATGYVGILNQGVTCYMNSLLQVLYNIPIFRKLVYSAETLFHQDPMKSPLIQLQILFRSLQVSNKAVSTNDLTHAFGWSHEEVSTQQDMSEFYVVLLDYLKRFLFESVVNDLFGVRQQKIAHVINFEADRNLGPPENSTILSLNIDGFYTISDAVAAMSTPEMMDEPISIAGMGMQLVALKNKIEKLPIVLAIQLMRFTYNIVGERMKLTHKVTYTPYLTIEDNLYSLHAIIVHQGSAYGGHYFAYIRPTISDEWFEFNDSTVKKVTEKEVYEGSGVNGAYMLFYASVEHESLIYEPVSIPKQIEDRYHEVTAGVSRFRVYTQQTMFDPKKFNPKPKIVDISNTTSFDALKEIIREAADIPGECALYALTNNPPFIEVLESVPSGGCPILACSATVMSPTVAPLFVYKFDPTNSQVLTPIFLPPSADRSSVSSLCSSIFSEMPQYVFSISLDGMPTPMATSDPVTAPLSTIVLQMSDIPISIDGKYVYTQRGNLGSTYEDFFNALNFSINTSLRFSNSIRELNKIILPSQIPMESFINVIRSIYPETEGSAIRVFSSFNRFEHFEDVPLSSEYFYPHEDAEYVISLDYDQRLIPVFVKRENTLDLQWVDEGSMASCIHGPGRRIVTDHSRFKAELPDDTPITSMPEGVVRFLNLPSNLRDRQLLSLLEVSIEFIRELDIDGNVSFIDVDSTETFGVVRTAIMCAFGVPESDRHEVKAVYETDHGSSTPSDDQLMADIMREPGRVRIIYARRPYRAEIGVRIH